MKIQAYRCTWDGDTRQWMQYHDHTDPLPEEWDDDPPDEVAALVLKIDADIEIDRLRNELRKCDCPMPINETQDDSTEWCCENGHCGCGRNHMLGIEKGHGYAVPNA